MYRYSVAREILRSLQIDATVFDLSAYSFRARVTFEDFGLRLGRPPYFPLALAEASPAMVRSLMRLRSNSALCGAPHKAQFERDLIRERTRAGLAAAAARGRTGGRQPVVTKEKLRRARELVDKGLTVREAAYLLPGRQNGKADTPPGFGGRLV